MIIKRVAVGDSGEELPSLPLPEKTPTPRVIIKMKKTAKLQLCRQIAEESAPLADSNFFNDTDYFQHQHRSIETHREQKQHVVPRTFAQTISSKPKQNLSDCKLQQSHWGARQDLSRNLFFSFLKKQAVQVEQTNPLLSSQINSQRHRKYSCPNNRRDIFEAPCPVFIRGSSSQQQGDCCQQLANITLKLSKDNHSCFVVNPYTHKEYLHQRVTQSSNQQRRKNFRSHDYSIIKPNEIKAVPFSNRAEKAIPRRKSERKQFPQLVAALKRKQQLWAERVQREREDMRVMVQTSYLNRRREMFRDQGNALEPWEVEGQPNLADIL